MIPHIAPGHSLCVGRDGRIFIGRRPNADLRALRGNYWKIAGRGCCEAAGLIRRLQISGSSVTSCIRRAIVLLLRGLIRRWRCTVVQLGWIGTKGKMWYRGFGHSNSQVVCMPRPA